MLASYLRATSHPDKRTVVLESDCSSYKLSLIGSTFPVSARPGSSGLSSLTVGLPDDIDSQVHILAVAVSGLREYGSGYDPFSDSRVEWDNHSFLLEVTKHSSHPDCPFVKVTRDAEQWSPPADRLIQLVDERYVEVMIDGELYTTEQHYGKKDSPLIIRTLPAHQANLLLQYATGQVDAEAVKQAEADYQESQLSGEIDRRSQTANDNALTDTAIVLNHLRDGLQRIRQSTKLWGPWRRDRVVSDVLDELRDDIDWRP